MKTAGRHPVVIRNIETSRGVVQYSIYDFLKEIKNKPVIWNRMHIDHKNNAIFEENWNILSRIFVPFIGQLDEEEKTQIIDELKTYWLHLRKNLMKTILTAKKGKTKHCHYLHHIEFFLNSKNRYLKDIATEDEIKTLKENEIKLRAAAGLSPPTNFNGKRPRLNDDDVASCSNIVKATSSKRDVENTLNDKSKSIPSKAKIQNVSMNSPQTLNDFYDPMSMCETASQQTTEDDEASGLVFEPRYDYRQQQQNTNIRIQRFAAESGATNRSNPNFTNKMDDANQAFFDSIKPTLRNFNDSQKLDFKIEVLKTLKKYKLY